MPCLDPDGRCRTCVRFNPVPTLQIPPTWQGECNIYRLQRRETDGCAEYQEHRNPKAKEAP